MIEDVRTPVVDTPNPVNTQVADDPDEQKIITTPKRDVKAERKLRAKRITVEIKSIDEKPEINE